MVRVVACGLWGLFVLLVVVVRGIPADVVGIVLLIWLFSIAWNIERPPASHARFALDWGPLVVILVAYTYTRGLADDLGIEAYGSPTTTSPVQQDPLRKAQATVHELGALAVYFLSGGAPQVEVPGG